MNFLEKFKSFLKESDQINASPSGESILSDDIVEKIVKQRIEDRRLEKEIDEYITVMVKVFPNGEFLITDPENEGKIHVEDYAIHDIQTAKYKDVDIEKLIIDTYVDQINIIKEVLNDNN